MNAAEYDAAQKRRRSVIVGRRRDLPPILLAKASRPRTVRDAIGATPKSVRAEVPVRRTTISVANGSIDSPGVFRTTDLHITRNFTELSLRQFAAIKPGGNRHDLPHELRAPAGGAQRRVA